MTAFLAALAAALQSIPILDKYIQMFIIEYINSGIDSMAADNRAAIKKTITDKDQIDLEKVLGNSHAGEPSNIPGVELRDTIGGVSDKTRG